MKVQKKRAAPTSMHDLAGLVNKINEYAKN